MKWKKHYMLTGELVSSKRGKHVKTKSLILREDFQIELLGYLRSIPDVQRKPSKLARHIHTSFLFRFADENTPVVPVCSKTVKRWMLMLGFEKRIHKKNYYVDGHEREDVKAYRQEFVDKMLGNDEKGIRGYCSRMVTYADDPGDKATNRPPQERFLPIPPELNGGEKRIVFVVHDESIFYSNDATKIIWTRCEDLNSLRPKSNGKSLMVSGLMCSCHGFLCGEISTNGVSRTVKSYKIIKPGKNKDGYWKNKDLVAQVEDCIPLFEAIHPNCEMLFAFDNSQNHHAAPPDALKVSKFTLNDKKQTIKDPILLRDTQFIDSEGNIVQQTFYKNDGTVIKGIKEVLEERGLWDQVANLGKRGGKLMTCEHCSNTKRTMDDPITNCCATRMLAVQPDFAETTEWMEEVIVSKGHHIIFFPKFHCELNYIEMVWAYMKSDTRENCTFDFDNLCARVENLLENGIPLSTIRKFEERCFRFMHGYQLNLAGPLLDYAVKKYTSHRMFPSSFVAEEFEQLYQDHLKSKKTVGKN